MDTALVVAYNLHIMMYVMFWKFSEIFITVIYAIT